MRSRLISMSKVTSLTCAVACRVDTRVAGWKSGASSATNLALYQFCRSGNCHKSCTRPVVVVAGTCRTPGHAAETCWWELHSLVVLRVPLLSLLCWKPVQLVLLRN